jgi:multimeric flavodoxin WrbA
VQPVAHDEPARGQRIDSELKKLSRNREACLRLIKLNILQINSSARGTGSESTRHADIVVSPLKMTTHSATVIRRDLASAPLQHIDEFAPTALFTAPEERNAEQAARVAIDDALIAEVQSADVLAIGAPMYNFGVTVQLKSWLDAIAAHGSHSAIRKAVRKVCTTSRSVAAMWPRKTRRVFAAADQAPLAGQYACLRRGQSLEADEAGRCRSGTLHS